MHFAKFITVLLLLCVLNADAQPPSSDDDLTALSVDDLMDVEVTSVARRGEKLSDTAAAVFVITREDIRRSGAVSIPEVLRMAPGMSVARINGNAWAVGSRGVRARFANKVLVLIDGRSVYSQAFGGVHWDTLDLALEDIERIEVIRGPGGSIWGANAVNGVINIITKHTVETQGTHATVSASTIEHARTGARYGGAFGANAYYRVFAKADDRASSLDEGRRSWSDRSRFGRAGFRIDWSSGKGSSILLAAEGYGGDAKSRSDLPSFDDPFGGMRNVDMHLRGANLLFRWTATQSRTSETTLQVSYDHAQRVQTDLVDRSRIADVDFEHELSRWKRHTIVWGAAYRASDIEVRDPMRVVDVFPRQVTTHLFSGFAQDRIELGKRVRVTLGSKFQYDRDTSLQMQPTLRALWTPTQHQSLWVAGTDTVRTANLMETRSRVDGPATPASDPKFIVVQRNRDFQPERARTYEIGYRAQPLSRFAFDLTAFHTRYRNLAHVVVGVGDADDDQPINVPRNLESALGGTGRGFEATATFDATSSWQLAGSYSFSDDMELRTGANDRVENISMHTPRHHAVLRSGWTIGGRWEIDNAIYYTSEVALQQLPAYTRFDARIAWHPSSAWDLSIAGQNLFDDRHREYNGSDSVASTTTIPRSVYGSVTWHF